MNEVLNDIAVKEPTVSNRLTTEPTPRVKRIREDFLNIESSVAIDRARIETDPTASGPATDGRCSDRESTDGCRRRTSERRALRRARTHRS